MASNKKFELYLDFLLDMRYDQAKLKQLSKKMADALEDAQPELDIDADKMENAISDVVKSLGKIEDAAADIELNNLEVDIDAKKGLASLEDLQELLDVIMESGENFDLSAIEEMMKMLSDSDMEAAAAVIEDFSNNFDGKKWKSDVEKMASGFDQAKNETEQLLSTMKTARAQMKLAGEEGSESWNKLEKEIADTEEQLDKYNDALGNLDDVAGAESFTDVMSKFEAVGQLGDTISEFAEQGVEAKNALREVAAQTGLTADELDRLNESAKQAFREGVGESLAESVKIMGYAQNTLGNFLDADGVEQMAIGAGKLAKVFDEDVNRVIGASRTMISEYGLDGQEAFEAVSYVMQNTQGLMEDGLDTIDEYANQAKRAGMSLYEFIGIQQASMEAGARDTDKTLDAVKEANIRLMEGDISTELLDAIDVYGEQLPEQLAKTIQGIVKAGEQGKKTTAEVMKDTSKEILNAFEEGDISSVVRDKLSRAISGTMAEDMGGEMWTKIFSQDIDVDAVKNQAATAANAVEDAVGAVTIVDKLQKELELFAQSSAQAIAPYAAGAGKIMQQVAKVAPAIQLFKDMAGPIKNVALSLIQKLVPGLVTTTAATGTATGAQWAFNAAMLANPITGVIAGVIALVGALKLLSSALKKTAAEKAEEIEADQKLIDKQQQLNQSQQDRIKNNQQLVSEYEILAQKSNRTAEEEERLQRVTAELNSEYPNAIKSTNSYAENMLNLTNKVVEGKEELAKLRKGMQDLDAEADKAAMAKFGNDIDIAGEKIEDIMTDENKSLRWEFLFVSPAAAFEDWIGEWVVGSSRARQEAKEQIEGLANGIKDASNDTEVSKAVSEAIDALKTDESFADIDDEAKKQLIENWEAMGQARLQEIQKQNEIAAKEAAYGTEAFKKEFEKMAAAVDGLDVVLSKEKSLKAVIQPSINMDKLTTDYNDIQNQINDLVTKSAKAPLSDEETKKLDELKLKSQELAKEIGKIAPVARENLKTMVDDNGELVETFDLNIEKAKEFADAQRRTYTDDLANNQQQYVDHVEQLASSYSGQMKMVNDTVEEINQAVVNGDKEQAESAKRKYEAMRKKVDETRGAIISMMKKGQASGLEHEEAIDAVAKAFGLSEEEVQKLIDAQEESKKKTEEQVDGVQLLADAWGKATSAAQKELNKNLAAYNELEAKKVEQGGKLTEEQKKEQENIAKSIRLKHEEVKENEKINKQTRIKFGLEEAASKKSTKQKKSAVDLAKEELSNLNEKLDYEKQMFEYSQNQKILEEGRQRDAYDDLILREKALEIEKQRKTLTEDVLKGYNLMNEQGEINLKLKEPDQIEFKKLVNDVEQNIQDETLDLEKIKVDIEADEQAIAELTEEIEAEKKTIEEKELEVKIALGWEKADAINEMGNNIELKLREVQAKIRENHEKEIELTNERDKKLAELEKKREAGEDVSWQIKQVEARYGRLIKENKKAGLELKQVEQDAYSERRDNRNEYYEALLNDSQSYYDSEIETINQKYDEQIERIEVFNSKYADKVKEGYEKRHSNDLSTIDNKEQQKLDKLNSWRDADLISEEDYEKRKLEITEESASKREKLEEEYRKKMQAIESAQAGFELEMQREADVAKLEAEKEKAQKEIEIFQEKSGFQSDEMAQLQGLQQQYIEAQAEAEKEGSDEYKRQMQEKADAAMESMQQMALQQGVSQEDFDYFMQLGNSLSETEKTLKEKGSTYNLLMGELTGSITDGISGLFAGGGVEALEENARDFLGKVAGIIQKKISAFVIEMLLTPGVIEFLSFLPPPLIPGALIGAQQIITAAVKGLTDPIISEILSFSTGGRVDDPTLAIIGDAASEGGRNTEWVTRDADIVALATAGARIANKEVIDAVNRLSAKIEGLELTAVIKGDDILLTVRRAEASIERRKRG